MQRCEYRDDCLPGRFPGGGVTVCLLEEDGAVEICRHRQPMPCGHPRLYLRWAPSQFSQTTVWCSKCEEEQGSDGRADKTWHDDDGPEM